MRKTASELQAKSDRTGQKIRKYLPRPLKIFLKKIYFFLFDLKYYMGGGKHTMAPPPSKHFIGIENYLGIGKEFFSYFKDFGGLKPSDTILDIGCGSGRMAIPITGYLSEGEYYGFDIIQNQVEWAQKNISVKFPNFHFQHVQVVNPIYNKKGIDADKFSFPFENDMFDFIYLTSVFTHMLPKDFNNYLCEINRVLRSDGRCIATFFVLNDQSRTLIQSNKSTMNFIHEVSSNDCLTNDLSAPEEAIAYDELYIKDSLKENNLEMLLPIKYGSWAGREEYLSFQDILILKKIVNQ